MRTRTKFMALAIALGGVIIIIVSSCSGGGPAKPSSMAAWEAQTQNDPRFSALSAEVANNNLSTNPAACRDVASAAQDLYKNHPVSPIDDDDWTKALGSLRDEYNALCAGDVTTAGADAGSAATYLQQFTAAVTAKDPGFQPVGGL